MFSPDTRAVGVATQRTDVAALVVRFCVQLLLKRGATTLSLQNAVTTKTMPSVAQSGRVHCCEQSVNPITNVEPSFKPWRSSATDAGWRDMSKKYPNHGDL